MDVRQRDCSSRKRHQDPLRPTVGVHQGGSLQGFGTRNALYALGRMLVQLLLIGYVLAWIFGAIFLLQISRALTAALLAVARSLC